MMPSSPENNVLDSTVTFLSQRDGIDKTLKILRYGTKLLLACGAISNVDSQSYKNLSSIESSIGVSRKTYRMGKFLQNVTALRKIPLRAPHALLEVTVNIGECIYYFTDQFQWLVKIGVLPKSYGRGMTRVSATAELVGYVANIILNVLRLHNLLEREIALIAELNRRQKLASQKHPGNGEKVDEKEVPLVSEIKQLRARRALRTLCLAQDIADGLLAINDLKEVSGHALPSSATQKMFLAGAGLLSGCIGAYKKWPPRL